MDTFIRGSNGPLQADERTLKWPIVRWTQLRGTSSTPLTSSSAAAGAESIWSRRLSTYHMPYLPVKYDYL